MEICFFEGNKQFMDAIGAGIYEIKICKNKNGKTKEKVLYIGESVFVLVRCAYHLYKLRKDPTYFGFTEDMSKYPDVTLRFSLLKLQDDQTSRRREEKDIISEEKEQPLTQSGKSDRMKSKEEKIAAVREFLEEAGK